MVEKLHALTGGSDPKLDALHSMLNFEIALALLF